MAPQGDPSRWPPSGPVFSPFANAEASQSATITPAIAPPPAGPTSSSSPHSISGTLTLTIDVAGSAPSSSASSHPYGSYSQAGSHVGTVGLPPFLLAVAVIVPLLIVGISTVALCRIIRSRRRQREARPAMPAMKKLTRRPPDERAYVRPPSESTSLTTDTPPPTTQRQSQPVILSTTMDQAYYTGLDTADRISLTDARSQMSADLYDGDEPPPPYRPRSVPPISRDASVRTSHTSRTSSTLRRNNDHSATLLMSSARRGHDWRSPFEDPAHQDDTASLTSDATIRPQRHTPHHDRLSVVSDLSYQDEPVTGGSAV